MLLPLRILGQLGNYPVIMLILRQMVSVLPMLIGLLILVYLQDGFRTYRSPLLFTFLLFVPAVLANNLWWHVDGLVFLLIMLVIYFLRKDDLRFDKNFIIAAALIGCATAAKLVGLYFFLAIAILPGNWLAGGKSPFEKVDPHGPAVPAGHGAGLPDLQSLSGLVLGTRRIQDDL